MGLSGSPQSTLSRRVILLSIYAVIALAFPLAYKLTSVQRLPIDAGAIRRFSQDLEETGCVVRTPAQIAIEGIREEWKEDVQKWLTLASETSEGRETERVWCVDWRVGAGQKGEFEYTLSGLGVTLPSTQVSAHSVSLAIARRIALDLHLPFRDRLAEQVPISSKTSVQGQDLREPVPEPEVEQEGATTTAVQEAQVAPLPDLELPDDAAILSRLLARESHTGKYSDISISLPSHLLLHIHILNEDFSLTSALSPANTTFTNSLCTHLTPLREQLQPITNLGTATTWGIGKQTQDVQWSSLNWTEQYEWREEVEMMEMREVQYEEEEQSDDEEQPPTTRTLTRREPFRVKRNLTHVDWIPRNVHYLTPDQLEIFVDESGWDLADRGRSTEEEVRNFPYLFNGGSQDSDATSAQIKNLHFVIYNPSPAHQPLLYLGDGDSSDLLAAAQSQHNITQEAKNWGWIIPTWGGVVIYNGGDVTNAIPLIQDQLRLLLDVDVTPHSHWHLSRRTLHTRTVETVQTLQATLNSIEKLASLEIGKGVQKNVEVALEALRSLQIQPERYDLALSALNHASNAFYHPRMLGMLYFPAEHIYAVYTPLFGPLAVPLLLVGIKELRRIRRGRKSKKSKEGEEKSVKVE